MLALKRHGAPYKGLLSVAASEGLSADPTDPYFLALQGQPVESLRRRREALRQQGMEVLSRYAGSQATLSRRVPGPRRRPARFSARGSACRWRRLVASPPRSTGRTRPARDLFVAQVIGESMNRRVPNGAYCLFRARPQGTRQGRVVLAGHREISDSELGGHYTLKVYQSEKQSLPDGTWRHRRIILEPDSTEPGFEAITLENVPEGEFTIIAELIEVLG